MRLLTWNLDHSRTSVRSQQHELLASLAPDIEVLTEAGRPIDLKWKGKVVVASDPYRGNGESWVVIRGKTVVPVKFDIPFERMAAAATAIFEGTDFLVYGSVLPWRAATKHAPDVFHLPETGVPSSALYGAWLTDQLRDIWRLRRLYPNHQLLWLGDFNVPVLPPFEQHLPAASAMILGALEGMGLVAYNAEAEHRIQGLHTIDLICGPNNFIVNTSESVGATSEPLSDHRLYFTDVERVDRGDLSES